MNFKLKRNKLYNICLFSWILISILFGRTTLNATLGEIGTYIYSFGRLLIYLLLCLLILWGGLSRKKTIIIVITLIFLFISVNASGELVLIGIVLFVAASNKIDTKEIILIYLKAHILVTLLALIFALINFTDINIMHRGIIQRNSFGFSHPNGFGSEILTIMICYVSYRWNKIKSLELFICEIIGVLVLYPADCRMATAVLSFFIIITFIVKTFISYKINLKVIWNISLFMFITIILFTIYVSIFFSKENFLLNTLDYILSFRFSAIDAIYQIQGITLLGQKVLNTNLVGIDNSYARILLINGLIPFIILVIFCINIQYQFYKHKDIKMLLAFMAISLSGFIENNFFRIENNFCFLVGGSYLLSTYHMKKGQKIHDKNIN